jgi:hypothetical protein
MRGNETEGFGANFKAVLLSEGAAEGDLGLGGDGGGPVEVAAAGT